MLNPRHLLTGQSNVLRMLSCYFCPLDLRGGQICRKHGIVTSHIGVVPIFSAHKRLAEHRTWLETERLLLTTLQADGLG